MHLPEANLPVTRSLSTRMARWGLVIVGIYLLVALITPVLVSVGILPDANAGLENPIYSGPSWTHWCGTDRLGRDVCVRTMAGSGVALQVVLLAVGLALVVGLWASGRPLKAVFCLLGLSVLDILWAEQIDSSLGWGPRQ